MNINFPVHAIHQLLPLYFFDTERGEYTDTTRARYREELTPNVKQKVNRNVFSEAPWPWHMSPQQE